MQLAPPVVLAELNRLLDLTVHACLEQTQIAMQKPQAVLSGRPGDGAADVAASYCERWHRILGNVQLSVSQKVLISLPWRLRCCAVALAGSEGLVLQLSEQFAALTAPLPSG